LKLFTAKGVLSGHARYFYINGVVSSEGEYVNNLKSGEWRVYNEKGNLVMIEIWENGIVKEKKALDN
jgi:antitoxin component YwqK of YwqJK toxin-antitoxin module